MSHRFNLQGKNLFLTYPQCSTTKEKALSNLLALFTEDKIKYAVISEEQHKDGTPHLHMQLAMHDKVRTRKQEFFDDIGGKHGNYQVTKKPLENMVYITKGNNFLEYKINVRDFLKAGRSKQSTKATLVAEAIKEGASIKELRDQYPGFYMMNKKQIVSFHNELNGEHQESLVNVKFQSPDFQLLPWQLECYERLMSQNARKVLWVYDPIGQKGKSELAKYLRYKGAFYTPGGKAADVAYEYAHQQIVCLDYPREKEEFLSYSLLEQFKNGMVHSPKYESMTKNVFQPKVAVFSNFFPDLSKLSSDRWDIYEIPESVINPHE